MCGLEALHDAIMHANGWSCTTLSNRLRNPGLLRGSRAVSHRMDANGYAVFDSIVLGSMALLVNLERYILGIADPRITPNSTLADLFKVYPSIANHHGAANYSSEVAYWCRCALGRNITIHTTLQDVCPELFEKEKPLWATKSP